MLLLTFPIKRTLLNSLPLTSEECESIELIEPSVEHYGPIDFRPTFYTRWAKSGIDRFLAMFALLIFAIPMCLVAATVLIAMGRPIFFVQRRIGLHGRVFNVLKFRTMGDNRRGATVDVPDDRRKTHKSAHDPRHTRVGRLLRQTSLDELPQLINILLGDMSIVGPRPELEEIVRLKYPPGLEQRHLVRPGLTGLWQISARGEGPMHENGEWDLKYVSDISFYTDLKIVLQTPLVLFGRHRGH